MTNSQRKRESAVVMSSTKPSAKYSCSASPLMFWNGRTAIEGLSGRLRAGRAEPKLSAGLSDRRRSVANSAFASALLRWSSSAGDRVDRTAELDQHAIAHDLDDPPTVGAHRRFQDGRLPLFQGGERAGFIPPP